MTRRDRIVIFLLWAFATAFNLAKPYQIDDPVYLDMARWITQHPLHPMSGLFSAHGFPDRFAAMNFPPLVSYVMAAWGAVFGYSEIAMHSLMSLFTLGAILVFWLLARRLAAPVALWLTAAFALSPGFVVSQNMMLDIPLVFLWLSFFYCLIRAHDGDFATNWLVRAGLCAAAACLVKYSSLALIAIAMLDGAANRKARVWLAAAIPLLALGAWSLFNLYDYGGFHMLSRPRREFGLEHLRNYGGGWLIDLGAIAPFTLPLFAALFGPRCQRIRAAGWAVLVLPLMVMPAVVLYAWTGFPEEQRTNRALQIVFYANAAALLGLFLRRAAPKGMSEFTGYLRRPDFLMLLWVLIASAFYIALSPAMAVRHVLLIVPPILLMAGALFGGPISIPTAVLGLAPAVALTAALGVSDWLFADFYRESAAQIAARFGGRGAIYFTQNWGWHWYAQANGFKPLNIYHPGLHIGDFAVLPRDIEAEEFSYPWMTEVERLTKETGPFTFFCTAAPSRFYATTTPENPWVLTRACGGKISVMRVDRTAE